MRPRRLASPNQRQGTRRNLARRLRCRPNSMRKSGPRCGAKKTERLTNVPFSITVGEIVPGTVHLYSLPVSILEYAPQYRDYEYILVGDEILIVDPRTLRIVAVIAA